MKSNATKIFVLICALGLVFLATPLRAQVAGATLSGTITDAQGGAVVGAKVSARNGATGVTTDSTTNGSGFYTIVNLNPADYAVSITAPGFRTAVSKVTLIVGGQQALNLALTVGEVSQTVEVTGAAPVVETTNATLSGEVESAQIVELPLNGRDWASLATLEPGVASVRPHEAVDAPGGSTRGLGVQMTVNGARPQQNVYRLNGVIVNDYSNAGPGNVLGGNAGVDAIQEFSVLTSNYSAEYGFTSGGVINAITRSGTNTFHGTAFDFLRNQAFDATNFFNNLSHLPKQPLKQNQFGASGGYKLLRDKLFLFGDYEGVRQTKGTSLTQFTISDAVRAGNVTNLSTGTVSAVPINSYIQQYLGFYPEPIGPANCTGCNANVGPYNWIAVQRTTENFFTVRGDLKVSNKDSMFATYVRDPSHYSLPQALNQVVVNFSAYRQAIVAEETHLFSSAFTNTVRVGLDRSSGLTNDYFGYASQALNPLATNNALNMIPGPTKSYG